ncbi:MAG: hypothetical protein U1E10_18665 [Bdellovibrionales bacterium]|nr:hypothetical protein [Bdellovibrionales bacterium]
MISDMFAAQQKTSQVGNLNSIRARLIETLNSPAHWTETVNHTSNDTALGCLREATAACATGFTSAFNVVETGPNVLYPAATATAGFRIDGTNCNTFSTVAPDPTCPFRWDITWVATCTGAGTCKTPDIQVLGVFQYAAGAKVNFGGGFNPATYSFDFRRGAQATRNETISLRYVLSGVSAAATTENGVCNAGWTTRQLNQITDPANIGATLAANAFTLPAGSYNCRAAAPGFRNGGNRIRLTRVSGAAFTDVESGIALATLNGGSITNIVDTSFRVNAPITLRVDHTCTQKPTDSPWGPGNNDNWSKGVPIPDGAGNYTNVTFTRVLCTRTGS